MKRIGNNERSGLRRGKKHIWLAAMGCMMYATTMHAQIQHDVSSKLVGTWVLDSVQVEETMAGVVERQTIRQPEMRAKFDALWMWQFSVNSQGKASYTEREARTITEVPYEIKDINTSGNATLIIDGVPDYKILNLQLVSDRTLRITHSFSTGYEMQDIAVSWIMYYPTLTKKARIKIQINK